jgi:hypothetical protein
MKLALTFLLLTSGVLNFAPTAGSQTHADSWMKYVDPEGRFTFYYPPEFGTPSPGTNNGYGQNVASIRFSAFSSGVRAGGIVLGGEATLTRGFVLVDLQALGGLYDSITLEAFPEPLRSRIISNLVPLTPSNFCNEFIRSRHVDAGAAAFAGLTAQQREALLRADRFRNINPQLQRCGFTEDTVVFDKEASFDGQSPADRQHIYGVVRFLPPPYSSFQIVRATKQPPAEGMLSKMAELVRSLTLSGRPQ